MFVCLLPFFGLLAFELFWYAYFSFSTNITYMYMLLEHIKWKISIFNKIFSDIVVMRKQNFKKMQYL